MANQLSEFEEMMMRNTPIQTSVLRNLTRWDSRNLQLAGLRIEVSRELQRRHLIPVRCDEWDPENMGKKCANTTEVIDEIRACTGYPVITRWPIILARRLEDEEIRLCLYNEQLEFWQRYPDDFSDTVGYPVHTKVCRRCRDFHAAKKLDEQLLMIARFRMPLCKQHSLEQANQSPVAACRCLDYLNGKWRCRSCCDETMYYMRRRAGIIRRSLKTVKTSWSSPWTYLQSLWVLVWGSEVQFCPIEGCMHQASLDENREERLHMCLGCNAISRI